MDDLCQDSKTGLQFFVSGIHINTFSHSFAEKNRFIGTLTLHFYHGYIQPISFLVQFSEGSSVLLHFLVADSQFPLSDLSFNLVIEFFA